MKPSVVFKQSAGENEGNNDRAIQAKTSEEKGSDRN